MSASNFVEEIWYGKHPLYLALLPLGWLFRLIVTIRYFAYQSGILHVKSVNVPVIIIGNISVGGNGKTPLVIWLANFLKQKGYKPGIVCRGYGGKAKKWPQQVRADSDPLMVGDEPVIIAGRTKLPVAASPKRIEAIEGLIEYTKCDIIICDDGLQHYKLARDLEIVVIDSIRRHGNQHCLPAGPLREPVSRLNDVDMIVCNGIPARGEHQMNIKLLPLISVRNEERRDIKSFRMEKIHAVAGIGNPKNFFQTLRKNGINIIEHPFPDHYVYNTKDINFGDGLGVIMTEKDAVKCREIAGNNCWYLPIEAIMGDTFIHRLENLLREISDGQKTA